VGGQLSLAVDMLKTCGGVFARGCTREFITTKSPKLFFVPFRQPKQGKSHFPQPPLSPMSSKPSLMKLSPSILLLR